MVGSKILLRLLSAWCSLALLCGATFVPAQSGRVQSPSSQTQGTTDRQSQRPRTVTPRAQTTATPNASPAATPTVVPVNELPSSQPNATLNPSNTATSSASPASADPSSEHIEVDEADVVRVNSNLVPVPASVIDPQGRAVIDLALTDFELMVDGERRAIGDLSRAETPVRMAVLFDNSSSLKANREFEKQAAVRFFKTVMRPVDQAALYSVSTAPTLVMPLTGNVKGLIRTIENFPHPEGATALFDAIAIAARYLGPHQGRKVIVIVSDGVDTISDLNFDSTLKEVLVSDCQIYAVQTGHSENANLRDLAAERRLQEFAAQTGGAVYVPKIPSDLNDAFAQIAADLAQQYILGYYPTDDRRDGRFRQFTLRITTRPNLRVRTRKGYYPPKG